MDFGRLSQNVGSNIQRMSSQVSDVERMVRSIGTPSDSTDLRERLHNQTHSIHDLAKDTGELIKRLEGVPASGDPAEQRQRKLLKEKLVTNFTDTLKRFQTAQREAAKKERESVTRAKANAGAAAAAGGAGAWNPFEDEPSKPSAPPGYQAAQTTLQIEEEVDLQALREREEAIRRLEADISDVNQIFKDLAVLVHEQGEVIDSIEANVETAQQHVEHGTSQLAQARNYQSKARRKKLCIISVLAIVLFVIGIIIYATQGS